VSAACCHQCAGNKINKMVYLVIILFHLVAAGICNSIERALKMHMARDFLKSFFLSLKKVRVMKRSTAALPTLET
jgi:hypothetical protein